MAYSKHNFQILSKHDVHHATIRHYYDKRNLSAGRPFALWQSFCLGILSALLTVGLCVSPFVTAQALLTFVLYVFAFVVFIKFIFLMVDKIRPVKLHLPQMDSPLEEYPVYSIVVAVYQEEKSVPYLIKSLSALNYPKDKLQILFMTEQDDTATIKAILEQSESYPDMDIMTYILPHSLPRTKPKALNAALPFLKGEYCVVYDAEDRPESEQLKKAAHAFAELPQDIVALQARLTFYNSNRSLLTKLFTLEYDVWFLHYLPMIARLKWPIPLSGTSTHFPVNELNGQP